MFLCYMDFTELQEYSLVYVHLLYFFIMDCVAHFFPMFEYAKKSNQQTHACTSIIIGNIICIHH